MPLYTVLIPSGSTSGRPIKVAATTTPGTLLHTAVAGTADVDEVYVYAVNSDAAAIKLTIELGGVTAPDDLVEFTVPPEDGLYLVIPGQRLNGGVVVRAFAGSANLINCVVQVNRITGI